MLRITKLVHTPGLSLKVPPNHASLEDYACHQNQL